MTTYATDPTLGLDLDNTSEWHLVDNVPVFDEHEEVQEAVVTNSQGDLERIKKVVHYDRTKLEEIAANCSRRELETGDLCPLLLGHTDPNKSETEQPKQVGWAKTWRVGAFGPQRKLAVLTKFYIKKEHLEEAKKYPRRSVELWQKENIIDPISLLIRTPQRDLGVLTYEKRFGRRIYSMDGMMGNQGMYAAEPDNSKGDEEKLGQGPAPAHDCRMYAKLHWQHPLMKHLSRKYGAEAGIDPEHPEAHMVEPEGHKPEEGPMKYEAAPGGSNTFTPTVGTGTKNPEPANQTPKSAEDALHQINEVSRMQREQDAIKYGKLEASIAELQKQNEAQKTLNADLVRKYQRATREKDLIQLEAEGYRFTRSEELDSVEDLEPEKYAKYLEKVRKNYNRQPTNAAPIPLAPNTEYRLEKTPEGDSQAVPVNNDGPTGRGAVKRYSKEQVARAIEICGDHPVVSYQEALDFSDKPADLAARITALEAKAKK